MEKAKKNFVIVTGLSGAGMTSVLKALEDFGYEVFDNFPLTLVSPLLSDESRPEKPIAIGLDSRARGFSDEAILKAAEEHKATLLFVTCDENVLQRRFIDTRRVHPMAHGKTVKSGIEKEKLSLENIQNNADIVLDTTHLSVHDLRHLLEGHFLGKNQKDMNITFMSFSYRKGTPREADIIMDVRFLKNPHWESTLKPLTGRDKAVGDYISKDEDFDFFLAHVTQILERLLPRYREEGKAYLTIAFGCSGGRHRSVFIAEKLHKWLKDRKVESRVEHRDLPEI